MAFRESCSKNESDQCKKRSEPQRHTSAPERRRNTLRRGRALMTKNDPASEDGSPSTTQTRLANAPEQHLGLTDSDVTSGTASADDDVATGEGNDDVIEQHDDNEKEGDALLSGGSENGRLRRAVSDGEPRSKRPLSSISEDTPPDRARRCARHLSNMSTDQTGSGRPNDRGHPDRCRQYLELCHDFFKPCCPRCKRCESESQQYTPSRQRGILKYEDSIIIPEDPFRKRCTRACMTFVYIILVLVAVVVTYSMLADLVKSMNNPVRSIHYHKVDKYNAPGIAVYPGGAEFLACGHYYNNIVTSKVRLTQLDLVNHNCSFTRIHYRDPHYPDIERDALVIRGPTSFTEREAVFLHFALEDDTRDFYTVSYFVFPNFDQFNTSADRTDKMVEYHRYMPTFALSAGLRMWIKLIMSETYLMDDSSHTEFNVEYSVVRFVDRRPDDERRRHLFFIFFEWKNDIIEQSRLLYSTTPWSIGAGLCGVFLTLHRVYQLAQTSYQRMRKDQHRRSIRKRTLRELRQRSMESGSGN